MFYAGINEDHLVALRIERKILVLKSLAIQADKTALLSENGSELVHDTTLDATIVVLRALAYLSKLELVNLVVKELIDGKSKGAFM